MPNKTKKEAKKEAKKVVAKAPQAKKSTKRGKRYTTKQKANVLEFVNAHNAEKGRGGAAAASRKFKISQITIGQWVKKFGGEAPSSSAPKKAGEPGRKPAKAAKGFGAKLRRLADVHDAIAKMESDLVSLKSEYAKLKKSL